MIRNQWVWVMGVFICKHPTKPKLVIIWYKKLVSFWKPTVLFRPHKMWFYQIVIPFVIVCESISSNLNSYELLDYQSSLDNVKILAKPVALLVDDAPENFKNVLYTLQRETFGESELWLITFNSSGRNCNFLNFIFV